MKKSRFFPALLALLLFLSLIPPACAEEPPVLTCGAAILIDGDNDEVLFEKNGYERMYPASITKIMTSLLVLEAVERGELSLDQPVTASETAIAAITPDSSTQNIKPGEVMPLIEVLYCDLVSSANEACNILAETVAGTMANFVVMMNQRAAELGMENTHFVNPNGLHDPQHYTTAYDIYLMAKVAMQYETFRTIVSTAKHEVPATNMSDARFLNNTNMLISSNRTPAYLYPKAIGIKTGSTDEAGNCLAAAAIDTNGRTFYSVVLYAQNVTDTDGNVTRYSFKESAELLEWGFNNFKRVVLLDETADMQEVPVTLSDEQDHVLVQPRGSLEHTMPADYDPENAELITDLPESVEAPVKAGTKLGTVTFIYDGVTYGTLDLVAVSDVSLSDVQYYTKTAKDFVDQWWVRAAVVLAVGLILFLIILFRFILPRRKRRNRYRYSGRRRRY